MQDIEWEKVFFFAIHIHEMDLYPTHKKTPTIKKDRKLYKNRQRI